MLKIGITTYYNNSHNYGGLLQSYALRRYLAQCNYCAEQICISAKGSSKSLVRYSNKKIFDKETYKNIFKIILSKFKKNWNRFVVRSLMNDIIKRRRNACATFREQIPHSSSKYDYKNMTDMIAQYDVFITGSDRVWNPSRVGYPFFLEFVERKPKISYAASLTTNSLSDDEKTYLKRVLSNYVAVSVREKASVELLQNLSKVNVEWALDPTLLLSQKEWDEICTERIVAKKYIFCYFLGSDRINRSLARKFARQKGLIIVTTPYAKDVFNWADLSFGDLRLFDVSPNQFISLIKNAEYVLTDSFHAIIFSTIYQKEYFVFEREELKGSGSRIECITSLCHTEDRFCNDDAKRRVEYLCATPLIDYELASRKVEEMRAKSKNFLRVALDLCEKNLSQT